MTWLVTGGAGYIGSHVVRAFIAEGIPAVVIDDLSSGHRSFVRGEVPFYKGSILQRELLDPRVERRRPLRAVIRPRGGATTAVVVGATELVTPPRSW